MSKNLKIAVTGGIGSGKSLATRTANEAGFFTISADQVTTDLYQTDEVKNLLKSMFPLAVTDEGIDRVAIAKEVFNDKQKHKELTGSITPLVIKEIERLISEREGVTIVEVPLLFECNYQDSFDGVLVIVRPFEERIKSVIKRSNISREQVIERMNTQVDYSALDLTPYTVIENDCDILTFKQKVLSAIDEIIKK